MAGLVLDALAANRSPARAEIGDHPAILFFRREPTERPLSRRMLPLSSLGTSGT
jgi:hypothetical protein